MPQSNQNNNQDKFNNQQTVIDKHNKKFKNHSWSVNSHFDELIYCGQSCSCCRARVQKEQGTIEYGACQICLKN
jgi:hypothetical protein